MYANQVSHLLKINCRGYSTHVAGALLSFPQTILSWLSGKYEFGPLLTEFTRLIAHGGSLYLLLNIVGVVFSHFFTPV